MAFGAADYAHDVRLACHGLDRDDNDFVIGLIGKDLFPLSALVQAMRKTQQTRSTSTASDRSSSAARSGSPNPRSLDRPTSCFGGRAWLFPFVRSAGIRMCRCRALGASAAITSAT